MIVHTRRRGTWAEQDVYATPPTPALARTCTVLEKIVLPVYYGQNTFAFGSHHSAHGWLARKRRGVEIAPVRQVYIHFQGMPQPACWQSAGPSFRKHIMVKVVCEEKTDLLAVSADSAYWEQLCDSCTGKLPEFEDFCNKYCGKDAGPDSRIGVFAFRLCEFIPWPWNEGGCELCGQ